MLSTAAHPPRLQSLVLSLRPRQWTKNLIVFAALLFGGHELRERGAGFGAAALQAAAAFFIFCLLSGVVYLVNDVGDREADRNHPIKALRPIASGALPVGAAITAAVVLAAGSIAAAFALDFGFGLAAVAYVTLLSAYSAWLKHIVILDVMTIAMGFVLRAGAGAVVIDVPLSHWALIVTILLALFLALSKRRHELVMLAGGASTHRPSLQEYSPYLLDQMISVVTAATVVAYASYTVSADTVAKFGTDQLVLTLPFPLYGIFRYLYLVHQREGGGSPSEMLLNDGPLLMCVALWAAAVGIILYSPW
jgi:4-hydroxybenzoate polyprenyltransferase